MPNWCRNEVQLNLDADSRYGELMIEAILTFVEETIPNFERRIRIEDVRDINKDIKSYIRGPLGRNWFDFNNLIPYPEEFKQRDEDAVLLSTRDFALKYGADAVVDSAAFGSYNKSGYNNGGYEWCIANWGTKWNASDVVWVPEQATIYFDTAWSPVFPIVSALHKRFPEVHINFEYYERGMGAIGGCEYLPESHWDESDFYYEAAKSMADVHEQYKNRVKDTPDDFMEAVAKELARAQKKPHLKLVDGAVEKLTAKTSPKWEAGRAYNSWSGDYMGFKGG